MVDGKYGENTGRDDKGRFASGPGNRGKPKGARHKTTIAVLDLIADESEALTRKVIELALEGDLAALKLCLERLAPPKREAFISLDLPSIENNADITKALVQIIQGVCCGQITTTQAKCVFDMFESYKKMKESEKFDFLIY